jgi:D-3-phosphoglycerate dehydrogenase
MQAGARARVLVREPIAAAGIELLRARFDVDVDGEGDIAERIGDYDAIVVRSATQLTADVLERATRLRVIGRAGVGVDNVDVEAATRRGIVVLNAPESTVVSAAEHALALLLALCRSVPQADASLRAGRWERSRFAGVELADKTLAVLGFGRIGREVARRARALTMHVLAYDPYVAADRFRELGVERAETLDDALAAADVVSLHLTLTEETRGLIGAAELARMRPGARLVNVARGGLVDEEALADALRSGQLSGAALDVFSEEPYSGDLLTLDSVVVTPHLGASTREAQDRAGLVVAEQVAAALAGALVPNAVNVPGVDPGELERLGPFLGLASQLSALAVGLAGGAPARLELGFRGELAERDTRVLTVAALDGVFRGRVEQPVNYVNAPLLARERGLEVVESREPDARGFTSLLTVTAGDVEVAGTTIAGRPRLVRALGYEIEVELDPLMLFVVNDDTPGRIGRFGTLLGEAGVNIANMAVSRDRSEGRALMALSVDSPVPETLLERLRAEPGFEDVRFLRVP